MRTDPETPPPGAGPLMALLRDADRRRRIRRALDRTGRALWPGLCLGLALALGWRATGARALALGAWVLIPASGVIGLALALRRADLLSAAAELDRRARLEGSLATGFEVATGRIAGPLAARALEEAERTSGGARLAEAVPVAPPGMRFLVIPAALLAAVALVPSTGVTGGRWTFVPPGARSRAAGAASGLRGERGDRGSAVHLREGTRRDPRAAREREADARERARGGAPRRLSSPPGAGLLGRTSRGASAAGRPGEGGPEDGGSPGGAGTGALGGAGPGPLDTDEAVTIRRRFPAYEELVRRYFRGPGG